MDEIAHRSGLLSASRLHIATQLHGACKLARVEAASGEYDDFQPHPPRRLRLRLIGGNEEQT